MARTQQRIIRRVGTYTFVDNQRLTIDLPRDYDYESIQLRFTGNANVTTAFTSVRAEAPLQVAKFISLKANGTDLLDGLTGIMAHRVGTFRRGQLSPISPPPAATVAAQPFSMACILDRAVIDGIRSKDGNFPARGLSTFQIEVTIGACADLFVVGAGVGTFTSGQLEVCVVQMIENVGADGKVTLPRVVTKRTQMTLTGFGTTNNLQQRINTGNLMRGLVLRGSILNGTANDGNDTVINNVKLQRGNTVYFDLPYAAIRALNIAAYEIASLPTGVCVVDFCGFGQPANRMSDAVDFRGGDDVYLILDVNGASTPQIDIATLEFMPYNPGYWGIKQAA